GPVPKEGVIGLHAEAAGAATPDVIRVVEDERDVPLEIIARTDAVTVVEGSVTDWSGAPIEGARVGFRRAVQTPDGQVFGWNALPLAGRPQLVTDSRGRFVTPVPLAETRQYAITVEGDGLMKHESALPDLASADARVVLEPIVVHRERRVAG